MEHLLVATFKSIRDELLANTIETGAVIVQTYIPGVSENTLCLPYRNYVKSEGYIENDGTAKGFVISPWSGKSPNPDYVGDLEVLYEDVNFRFKSEFRATNCTITPNSNNTLLLGSNYKATVAANTNYKLTNVTVNGTAVAHSDTTATINLDNILGDVIIIAEAELNTHTITYSFDSTCVESSNTATEITHGETYVTTLSKKEGYATLGAGNVTVGGIQKDSWNEMSGSKQISVVADGDIVITAACGTLEEYPVTLNAEGCVVMTSPTGSNPTVTRGDNVTITLEPASGYTNIGPGNIKVGNATKDFWDTEVPNRTTTLTNVTGPVVITVTGCGSLEKYTITLHAGDCVIMNPVSGTEVERGSNVDITLTPNTELEYSNIGAGRVTVNGIEKQNWNAGASQVDLHLENVDGNIEVYADCGTPIPTEYPVTINWIKQDDLTQIHTETLTVDAGVTIAPENYENDWNFDGYEDYEIKSMNPTRGTSIVVNEPKTIIYYCGLKDIPVSKYEVEVKYVKLENAQYVSIPGPVSDYTLGEFDEGTIIISNQQSINTNDTDDYKFLRFDPDELNVSSSNKTIYVVYSEKGTYEIRYVNISEKGCVSSTNMNTSVQEGDSYRTTFILDTNKYTDATVTINGSFSDTITLNENNPQQTVTFSVSEDTTITAECGTIKRYSLTYNHVAITEESEEIIADTEVLSEEYGTELSISDIENKRKSYPSEQYSEYVQDAGEYYSVDRGSNFNPIPQTLIIQCDTIVNIYYSKTPQGQIRFDYYIDNTLVTNLTVTENVGISVTLNEYKDLPSDILNPEYYEFDSFDPNVQTITVDNSILVVKVYYTTKKITLTFKYTDSIEQIPITGVSDESLELNIGSEYCEEDFGSIKKSIEHYTYLRSTLQGRCQTFTTDSTIYLFYDKDLFDVTYNYVDTNLNIIDTNTVREYYETVININDHILDIENYNYTNQYNTIPDTAQNDLIIITKDTTITYVYELAEEPCQPTCSLTKVAVQTTPNGYQVSSVFDDPDKIIEVLSNQVSIEYQTSDMEHEEVTSVSDLGWTIIIPDNITVSSDPYTGQVIDCSCNSHDFNFYYGEYNPYIEVLIGCYNLNNGTTPRENIDYRVKTSYSSYTVETQVDQNEEFVSITVSSGGRQYTAYIPICPHFKVTLDYGNDAQIGTRSGAYPWYGSESNFIITPRESGKIITRVTLIVKDHDTGRYLYKLLFGPVTKLSEYSGKYEVDLSYGTVNHLGTTQTNEAVEITINETGDYWDVKFVNIKGDLYIEVQNYPANCLKQVVYRHCTKLNGNIVPISEAQDSTYWVYDDIAGINLDQNVVTSLPGYEEYKYEGTYITGTSTSQVRTTCDDNQRYDLVYIPPCTITLICKFNGETLCESEIKEANPPTYITLPTRGGSGCDNIYSDYKVDTATSSTGRTLKIADTEKAIYAGTEYGTRFECGEIVTANLIKDEDAKLLCYFIKDPRIIINKHAERRKKIEIGVDGHCYVEADEYKLFNNGTFTFNSSKVLSLTFAGDFGDDGYILENATTQISTADIDNLNCRLNKCYRFSNLSNNKFIIPYEGSYTRETYGVEIECS